MKTRIKIGKIIRDARLEKDLTQLDVARKLGYQSTQFVSLFERGLSKCPVRVLGKVCRALNINAEMVSQLLISEYSEQINKDLGIK